MKPPSMARTVFNCAFLAPLIGAVPALALGSWFVFWLAGGVVAAVFALSGNEKRRIWALDEPPQPSAPGGVLPPPPPAPRAAAEPVIACPKCGSTQWTANRKGFGAGKAVAGALLTGGIGLLFGFAGSGKVMLTCLHCGKRWKPGATR